jgi:cation diffusion facilitator family transporter
MTEVQDRRRASYQVLLATLWLTLLVLAVKIWAAWAMQSLSLLAEALHTLVDGFSTVLSLIAVASPHRVMGREIWTHGRRLTAGTLLLAAFIGFTGFSLLGISIQQLQAATQNLPLLFPAQINLSLIQLVGVVTAINVCLVLFERYEARILESSALRLNADYILKHTWLTVLVIIGLIGASAGYFWLDPLMAIFAVLLLIKNYWQVLNWQLPLLVQQMAIAPEALAQLACQCEGVIRCYHVRSHGIVGRQVFVELHLGLHPDFLGSAHSVATCVEAAIRERYGPVYALIYVQEISVPTERR